MQLVETKPKQILAWTLFDFANTAFYVIILTVGYPLYFKEIVAGGKGFADALWGTAFSISMFVVALLSPILGAAADFGGRKKPYLGVFTFICIIATFALFFVRDGMILWGMLLLVLANVGFEAGLVFYDAFLPEIAPMESYGKISGYGFAMGYVGSLATLVIAYPLYLGGFGAENMLNVRLSFVLAASFFLIFAAPLFLMLSERKRERKVGLNFAVIGFRRVTSTYKEFPKYKNIARFLLSYFIYIDGVNTIIIFSSIFARETLKLEIGEIVVFFALVQTAAIMGSLIFGVTSDRIGHKRALELTLLLWILIVLISYFVVDKRLFFGIGFLAGIALGSSQSTSRSLMSTLTPQEKKTEFFGFFSFFGKASAILGPFLFGIVSSLVNQRVAILSVEIFLIVGLLLLRGVKSEKVSEKVQA
jgi:UMF1 family MFS transporter